jgi:hypothetical protein
MLHRIVAAQECDATMLLVAKKLGNNLIFQIICDYNLALPLLSLRHAHDFHAYLHS